MKSLGKFPDPFIAEISGQPDALRRAASGLRADAAVLHAIARSAAGRHLVFTGMGSSYDACYPVVTELAGAGIMATMIDAAELLHFRTAILEHDALLVAISQSGESAEVARWFASVPERQNVFGMTLDGASLLARTVPSLIAAGGPETAFAATRSLTVGDPAQPGHFLGPVIDAVAQQRIRSVIEDGAQRARLALYEPQSVPQAGCYVAPAIFADVAPEDALAQEEIFGPVLALLRAADFEQALAIANGTSYALTGGVYSRRPAHLQRARKSFRVGNLYLNRKITGAFVARQPFGGFKLSGIGSKAGGEDYLKQFTDPVCVTENTLRRGFAPDADESAS